MPFAAALLLGHAYKQRVSALSGTVVDQMANIGIQRIPRGAAVGMKSARGVAKAVLCLAVAHILHLLIRCVDLFHLLLRACLQLGLPRIAVGVIFPRQSAIGFFYLVLVGIRTDTENLIRIVHAPRSPLHWHSFFST